jgi:hypothetical protein
MAGLIVALGASACANDYSLDFGGDPTHIQASPQVMFVNQGATENLLVRLVNDRNQSTPAVFTVSNVGAGITVVRDEDYRPDNVNPEKTLQSDEMQNQMRFFVTANTNVSTSFTVTTGSFSQVITVRVVPTNVGGLSIAEPAIGDLVTITAPGDVSFNPATSTVSFDNTGDAVITEITAKSITFIPIPGSTGFATVDHVTADYAANLGEFTLKTTNEIIVPAITSVALSFSSMAPNTPVTVTAPAGYTLESGFSLGLTGGTKPAWVLSVAGDGTSAQVVLPADGAGPGVASGFHLNVLSAVSLADVNTTVDLNTGNGYNNGNPDGNAPTLMPTMPGTGFTFYDSYNNTGPDVIGGGGPLKWWRVVPGASGTYDVTVDWLVGSDVDFYYFDAGPTNFVGGAGTGNHPENFSAALTGGAEYWFVGVDWGEDMNGNLISITID